MPVHDLKEQIARLPEQPGVYLWSNAAGEALYVGKARSLRDRVRSYLGAYGLSPRHDALLDEVTRLEVIVTDSVMEALALENNLIKQRTPKYNILLRDDKNYPYLQLTTSEAFPRVLVARSVEKGADFYAGPFLPAKLARRTMTLAHRLFGIRSCNEVITGKRARPCLEYDIKRCIAPCVAEICTEERYGDAVASTRLLLEGRNDELAETLRERMADAAAGERFEEAAQLRDAMRTVQILRDRQQKVATAQLGDRDVFGLKLGPSGGALQVFAMRGGRVVERVELATDPGVSGVAESEVLQAALTQFYELRVPPAEVNLPVEIEDADAMEEWLSQQAGRRVKILVPQRGDKRALVELATRNAELSYRTRFNEMTAAHFDALETLRSVLGLSSLPRRIECFDISTIQGSETVAAMVVCEDGRMKKSEYRKFRVRGKTGIAGTGRGTEGAGLGIGDPGLGNRDSELGTWDTGFAADRTLPLDPGGGDSSISPLLIPGSRISAPESRIPSPEPPIPGPGSQIPDPESGIPSPESLIPGPESRIPNPGSPVPGPQSPIPSRAAGPDARFLNDFAAMREVVGRRYQKVMADGGPFPDLILIDGGKGQLSAAYEALEAIGLGNLVAAGIAKKEELLFTRDSADPIVLPESDPALLLIQRIRDEAHRFAVTFHRKARSMRDLRSELDSVPGIGPRRRRALLTAFGSLSGVRRATREELESVVGAKTATAVIDYFAHAR